MAEERKPNFKERLSASKTAFLSMPAQLRNGGDGKEQLAQVRKAFPWLRVVAYRGEFKSGADWRKHFREFIKDVDVLIVGCDSSRLIGSGVLYEINMARKAEKIIVLYKLDEDERRPFCGYERGGTQDKPVIRLKKRSETKGYQAKRKGAAR